MIDYKKELNEPQYEAVTTTEGPLLVLAGAGSGKTRTLIYRVCYLIQQGINPASILLLTFTNKAAHEMQERAEKMLGDAARQVTACTYHSFCTKMLRKYAFAAGLSKYFTVLSPGDPETIIQMMMVEMGLDKCSGFPSASRVVHIISSSINRELPIDEILMEEYPQFLAFAKQLEGLRKCADSYKKKNDLLDYDDIMLRFYELLKNNPSVAENIEKEFAYISIDEYQDTNPLQAKIIREIRKENHNLMVVGDDYQSIYGFRGSDMKNILNFPEDYPGTKVIFLTDNYRSTPEIIALSNELMEQHALNDRYKKRLRSPNPAGMVPAVVMTRDQDRSAAVIVENIEKAYASGRPYKEMCVLARSSNSTVMIESALQAHNIPYEKRGGQKFFELPHVCDFLAFLRVYTNPKDELSWFRILQTIRGIGEATARKIATILCNKGMEAFEYLRNEDGEIKELGEFFGSLDKAVTTSDVAHACKSFYIKKKKDAVVAMSTTPEMKKEEYGKVLKAEKDLDFLCSFTSEYLSAIEFLDNISFDSGSMQHESEKEEDTDAVVISTVHSSKGLEFEAVYIVDCVDGIFPGIPQSKHGTKEDQEELRCFYVAVTRAKKCLYLFVPAFAKGRKGMSKKYPAHYFNGLDKVVKIYQSKM